MLCTIDKFLFGSLHYIELFFIVNNAFVFEGIGKSIVHKPTLGRALTLSW